MELKKIHLLVKFGAKAHMESFLKEGHLFINPISYFKNLELDSEREDKYENITGLFQPKNVEVKIGDRIIKDFAGPITIFNPQQDTLGASHIFCMSHISDGSEFEEDMKIFDDKVRNFGDFMVIIVSPNKFLKRVSESLRQAWDKEDVFAYQTNRVEYFCDETYSGDVSIFHKSKRYKHQRELRIAINAKDREKPLSLKIGNLSDVAFLVSMDDFKNRVEIKEDGVDIIIN